MKLVIMTKSTYFVAIVLASFGIFYFSFLCNIKIKKVEFYFNLFYYFIFNYYLDAPVALVASSFTARIYSTRRAMNVQAFSEETSSIENPLDSFKISTP